MLRTTKTTISKKKNLEKKQELFTQFLNISNNFKKKFNLDNASAQRLGYYFLLRHFITQLKLSLPFKIEGSERFIQKSNFEYNIKPDLLSRDRHQLDQLYHEVKIDYRKKTGQILTPFKVADFMTSWGISEKTSHILDPAVGTGIFLDLSLQKISNKSECKLVGIDIDPLMLNATAIRIGLEDSFFKHLTLLHNNFLTMKSYNKKFDFVICNPPYLNFHDYDHVNLTKNIGKTFNLKISQLTNIYSLFFMQATKFIKKSGKIAFITPSEFFYTGYGKLLKKFLIENFTIEAFIIFDFSETLFHGILTTAVITLLVNKPCTKSHNVKFIKLKEWPENNNKLLKTIKSLPTTSDFSIHVVSQKQLDPYEKWLMYFEKNNHRDLIEKLTPLSNIGTVNRGIATGFNSFFTISEKEREKWGIEEKFFKPVVSRVNQTHGYIFTNEDYEKLKENQKNVLLLYCFEKPTEKLKKYLKYGEEIKAHKRYICAHRKPWFSMEKGSVAPILATVFSRDKMRFIYNQAKCLNLAAYHGIYLNFDNELMIKALLCFLNSDICKEIQIIKRREYGGGLHKFEPGDMEFLPVLDVTKLKENDIKILANLFDDLSIIEEKESSLLKKTIDKEILRILN